MYLVLPYLVARLAAEHRKRAEARHQYDKQWRLDHPESIKEYRKRSEKRIIKRWRMRHKLRQKQWRLDHPEAYQAIRQRYYQSAKDQEASRRSNEQRRLVTCAECGQVVERDRSIAFRSHRHRVFSLCLACHAPAPDRDPILDFVPVLPEVAEDLGPALRLEERLQALEACLIELPEKRRIIIQLRLEGLTQLEIGQRYHVTRQYVCFEEERAKYQLRQRLRYREALQQVAKTKSEL